MNNIDRTNAKNQTTYTCTGYPEHRRVYFRDIIKEGLTITEMKECMSRLEGIPANYVICVHCLSSYPVNADNVTCAKTGLYTCKLILLLSTFVREEKRLSYVVMKLCENCPNKFICFSM